MNPRQRSLPFDHATLIREIGRIRPRPAQTLFRGLLMIAAMQPRSVSDIDDDGFVLMQASMDTVARWAGAHVRTIQRARTAAAASGLVDASTGLNTVTEWCFDLCKVLPPESVPWFRGLVETGPISENATPAIQNATPAFRRQTPPQQVTNATPGVSDPTSYCFELNTASSAVFFQKCSEAGFSASGTTWKDLRCNDEVLKVPTLVLELFNLAADSGVLERDEINQQRLFVAALVSSGKEYPWSYFRAMVLKRQHVTTKATPAVLKRAAEMLRTVVPNAEPTAVSSNASEEWDRLTKLVRRFDVRHEVDKIYRLLGPDVAQVAKELGMIRISGANSFESQKLRSEFIGKLNEQRMAPCQR